VVADPPVEVFADDDEAGGSELCEPGGEDKGHRRVEHRDGAVQLHPTLLQQIEVFAGLRGAEIDGLCLDDAVRGELEPDRGCHAAPDELARGCSRRVPEDGQGLEPRIGQAETQELAENKLPRRPLAVAPDESVAETADPANVTADRVRVERRRSSRAHSAVRRGRSVSRRRRKREES
jgi:hypothetical protein